MTAERRALLAALMAAEAVAFFAGAVLHTGAPVSIGPTEVREPRIVPAVIVESACGLALAVGACGLAFDRFWSRRGAVAANTLALAGTALGMVALAFGRGPRTALNDAFHRGVVLMLLLGLGLLWQSSRAAEAELTRE